MPETSTTQCFDCEREISVRAVQHHEVVVEYDDEPGYDYIRVPLCRGCAFDRFGVECDAPRCTQQFLDQGRMMEHYVQEHTEPEREPVPDGGATPQQRVDALEEENDA